MLTEKIIENAENILRLIEGEIITKEEVRKMLELEEDQEKKEEND